MCAMNLTGTEKNLSCTKLVDDMNDEAFQTQSEEMNDSAVSDYAQEMTKRIVQRMNKDKIEIKQLILSFNVDKIVVHKLMQAD